jgi:hypothetical protein
MGECKHGVVQCNEQGEPLCVGFVDPSQEICDGLDNDCDGKVDDYSVFDPVDCHNLFCGRCASAVAQCLSGTVQCVPVHASVVEVCNGHDDDCDCQIDNDIPTLFWYDGPDNTVGRGQCLPGISYCSGGAVVETAPVYPSDEVCDGVDNDCDGVVDEDATPAAHAYYIVLDVSGSMGGRALQTFDAFCNFALAAPTGSLFAIATVTGDPNKPFVAVNQDFDDAAVTCATLTSYGFGATYSGIEYMLEALPQVISWPQMETTVVGVTDEPLDLFTTTPEDAAAFCLVQPFELVVFTHQIHQAEWLPILASCGGGVRDLYPTNTDPTAAISNALLGNCW